MRQSLSAVNSQLSGRRRVERDRHAVVHVSNIMPHLGLCTCCGATSEPLRPGRVIYGRYYSSKRQSHVVDYSTNVNCRTVELEHYLVKH